MQSNSIARIRGEEVEAPAFTETVDSFLKRGGVITKCPPGSAHMETTGVTKLDDEYVVTAFTPHEYVPNYVSSEGSWRDAQRNKPHNTTAAEIRHASRMSLPTQFRRSRRKPSEE